MLPFSRERQVAKALANRSDALELAEEMAKLGRQIAPATGDARDDLLLLHRLVRRRLVEVLGVEGDRFDDGELHRMAQRRAARRAPADDIDRGRFEAQLADGLPPGWSRRG